MVQAQATAAGIELQAIGTSWPETEARLAEELAKLRSEGFRGVVPGDIHVADVRVWYEDRVTAAGLEHIEAIWGEPPAELLRELVETGGRAVATGVDLTRLHSSWLRRSVDERFVDELALLQWISARMAGDWPRWVRLSTGLRPVSSPATGADWPSGHRRSLREDLKGEAGPQASKGVSGCALARVYVLVGLPIETCLAAAGAEVISRAHVIGAFALSRVHRHAADGIDGHCLRSYVASLP